MGLLKSIGSLGKTVSEAKRAYSYEASSLITEKLNKGPAVAKGSPDPGHGLMPSCVVIRNYTPRWARELNDFPFNLEGVTAYRPVNFEYPRNQESFSNLRMEIAVIEGRDGYEMIRVGDEDVVTVQNAINVANELIDSARVLTTFPWFHVSLPDSIEPDEHDPTFRNFCLLNAKPYTKTGKLAKFPVGIWVNHTGKDVRTSMEASLFPDGSIGRIVSTAQIDEGPLICITSTIRGEDLTVSRIEETDDNGPRTLWTLGR